MRKPLPNEGLPEKRKKVAMGLYERWTDNSGQTKISVHAFGCGCAEMARGSVTRQQMIDNFALTGSDITELDAIIAKYNGLANATQKAAYMTKFHDVMILCENGYYTKAKAQTELGF